VGCAGKEMWSRSLRWIRVLDNDYADACAEINLGDIELGMRESKR
jgi:hypothetical protein